MQVEAVQRVMAMRGIRASEKMVLLLLCGDAGDDWVASTREPFAARCCCSEATVNRALLALEGWRYIETLDGGDGKQVLVRKELLR